MTSCSRLIHVEAYWHTWKMILIIWVFLPPFTETCKTSVWNPASESNRHEWWRKSQRVSFGGEEEAIWTVQGEVLIIPASECWIINGGVERVHNEWHSEYWNTWDFLLYSNKFECHLVCVAVKQESSVQSSILCKLNITAIHCRKKNHTCATYTWSAYSSVLSLFIMLPF